jgi:lipid-A-disaccharide synthase
LFKAQKEALSVVMGNRVFFIAAGEISGDIHAADLMKKIRALEKDIAFVGLGGKNMLEAGLNSLGGDASYYSTMGLTDSLRFYFKNKNFFDKTISYLKTNKPDAVILVDNQGLNIPRAKATKKFGLKYGFRTFYYFPPHVSIWGRWNARLLPKITDYIITTFYNDYIVYKEYTDNVYFSGSPLLDKIGEYQLDPHFYENNNLDKTKKIAAILPGSRFQELETLLPVMLEASKILIEKYGFQIVLPISHPVFKDFIEKSILEYKLKDQIRVVTDSYAAMSVSDINILSSGTASLESVLFKKPTIICYKISALTFMIGKFLVKSDMIGFPNIVLKKKVFPELLQKDCNSENIIKHTLNYLNLDLQKQSELEQNYYIIKESLGKPPVVENVARYILERI